MTRSHFWKVTWPQAVGVWEQTLGFPQNMSEREVRAWLRDTRGFKRLPSGTKVERRVIE